MFKHKEKPKIDQWYLEHWEKIKSEGCLDCHGHVRSFFWEGPYQWLLFEYAMELAKAGRIAEIERLHIVKALQMLDYLYGYQEFIAWVQEAISNSADHDLVLRWAETYGLMTDKLVLKHAPHSQNATLRALGMLLQKRSR